MRWPVAVALVGATLQLPVLLDAAHADGARARAEILAQQAGTTRYLAEMVTGVVSTNVPPCAPITPHSGSVGHDHSGGLMGQPLQITVWSAFYGAITSADLAEGAAPNVHVDVDDDVEVLLKEDIRTVWVPGCQQGGAYESLEFAASLYTDADCQVVAEVSNRGIVARGSTFSITTGYNNVVGDALVVVHPGDVNVIALTFTVERVAADATVTLLCASLNQVMTAPRNVQSG